MIPFKRSRIAVHESGHVVMAIILGLDILECDISRKGSLKGGSGKCLVMDPDPVGLRRFLVSMGGILAEYMVFGDDRGGGRDRLDAGSSLLIYSSRYRRGDFDPGAESLIAQVSELFGRPVCRQAVMEIASILDKEGTLDGRTIEVFETRISVSIDTSAIDAALQGFTDPPPGISLKESVRMVISRLKRMIRKIRRF